MIVYKVNVLNFLKDNYNYTTTDLSGKGKEKGKDLNLGGSQLQKLRSGEMVGMKVIDQICRLTDRQPGDFIEYMPRDRVESLIRDGYFERRGMPNPVIKEGDE